MQSRQLSRIVVCSLMMMSVTAAIGQVPPMPGPGGPGPDQPPMEFVPQDGGEEQQNNPSSQTPGAPAGAQASDQSQPANAPAPATTPATTAPAPAQPQAVNDAYLRAEEESPSTTRVAFNFKDATVDAILDYLSDTLGFIVIKDSRITIRVTVTSRKPVSAEEAVDLLNSVLEQSNYSVLQRGRVLRVLPRDRAKKANVPVRFGADPTKIRNSDELITQVIPIGNVDAVKLKTDLSSLLSSDADVTSNAGSNTIIITDTSARIRRVVEVITALDSHRTAVNDIKTFQLKYSDATSTAKLINDVFKTDSSSSSSNSNNPFANFFNRNRGQGGFPGMPGQQNQQGDTSSNGNAIAGKVNAAADSRTNTVVVTGPADTLKLVERVIKEMDSNPAADQVFFIYPVKNGTAANMEYTLNSLFGNPTSAPTSSSGNSLTSSSTSSRGGSSSSSSSGTTSTGSNSNRQASITRSNSNNSMTSNLSGSTQTAASQLKGQVLVVSDSDTNSLLITATNQRYLEQTRQILAELDRSIKQVLIKVLVAEIQHTDSKDIGTSFGDGLTISESLGYVAPGGATAGSILNGATTPRSFYGTVSSSMSASLQALATKGKLDVLSRPSVLTSDNQPATMYVGQEVPYVSSTQVTDSGQTINNISREQLGITLNVTPHVNPSGMVVLDVIQEVSQISDSSVTVTGSTTSPIFDMRQANTRVAVINGQTIVIGGLMQDKKNSTIKKVPLLGDIPFLGEAFKRNDTEKVKTELLVFITPHVVPEPSVLKSVTQDEIQGVKIMPNALGPGVLEDHLKGMQRGATTQPTTLNVPPAVIEKED